MCGLYYWLWVDVVPRWKGYRIRQEVMLLENGAQANKLVKVPVEELDRWDRKHDASGRRLEGYVDHGSDSRSGSEDTQTVIGEERDLTKTTQTNIRTSVV